MANDSMIAPELLNQLLANYTKREDLVGKGFLIQRRGTERG